MNLAGINEKAASPFVSRGISQVEVLIYGLSSPPLNQIYPQPTIKMSSTLQFIESIYSH